MKYKINYKTNDEVHKLEQIIKFMESQDYKYDSYSNGLVLFVKPDIDDPSDEIYFELNLNNKYTNNKTISKYIQSTKTSNMNVLFTREELRFFDMLDFEINYFTRYGDLGQDITDWVDDV